MARAQRTTRSARTPRDPAIVAAPHLEPGETVVAGASQVDTGPVHPYLLLIIPIAIYLIALLLGIPLLSLAAGAGGLAGLFWSRRRFTRLTVLTDRRMLFFVERLMRGPDSGLADQVRRSQLSLVSSKKGVLFSRLQFDVAGPTEGEGAGIGRRLSLRVPRVNHAFIAEFGDAGPAQAGKAGPGKPGAPARRAVHDPSGRTTPKGGKRRRR